MHPFPSLYEPYAIGSQSHPTLLRSRADSKRAVFRLEVLVNFRSALRFFRVACWTFLLFAIAVEGVLIAQKPSSVYGDGESELRRAGSLRQQAIEMSQRNDLAGAIAKMEQSVEIAKKVLGNQDRNVASLLSELGRLYKDRGSYAKASKVFEETLTIFKKSGGLEDPDTIVALNDLASTHEQLGNYAAAKPLLEQAIQSSKKKWGEQHPDTLGSINNLANLLHSMGDHEKAKQHYLNLLASARKTFGSSHANTASVLSNLSEVLKELDDYPTALRYSLEALAIRQKLNNQPDPIIATNLDNLSVLYQLLGDSVQAKAKGLEAVDIFRKTLGNEHPETAISLLNVGSVSLKGGDPISARKYVEESLAILLKSVGSKDLKTASAMGSLARIEELDGNYSTARRLHEQALEIRREVLGENHPDTAAAISNMGHFLQSSGDLESAKTRFQQALESSTRVYGVDHSVTASSLQDLASIEHRLGNDSIAQSHFERALAIRVKIFGNDHDDVASLRNNFALFCIDRGDLNQAQNLLEQAIQARKKILGEFHPRMAVLYNNLGIVADHRKDHDGAIESYSRALAIGKKLFQENHPNIASTLANIAQSHFEAGRVDQALRFFDDSRRRFQSYERNMLPSLSSREQLLFLRNEEWTQLSIAIAFSQEAIEAPGVASTSMEWILNSKAVGHGLLLESNRFENSEQTPEQATIRKKLFQVRRELADLSTQPLNPDLLQKLTKEEESLSRELQSRGRGSIKIPVVTLEEVRAKLPSKSILIEFFKYRPLLGADGRTGESDRIDRYAAWILDSNRSASVMQIDLGNADEIDQQIADVRNAISASSDLSGSISADPSGSPKVDSLLRELSQKILVPLLPSIKDREHLFLSPDSDLWLVPWGALHPEESDRFLIENHTLTYLVSGRELAIGKRASTKTNPPAVFANPTFDLQPQGVFDAVRAVLRDKIPKNPDAERMRRLRSVNSDALKLGQNRLIPKVSPLPNTSAEAEFIKPNLKLLTKQEPLVYSEAYALESIVKALHSPKVVVLATHGYFIDQEIPPMQTGMSKRSLQVDEASDLPVERHPLLRCGLLLAGCNDRNAGANSVDDDGVLTGLEVCGLDLDGTQLVVLSACETGVGAVHGGEGVIGLRQAFQLAGAEAIVASLWSVPDRDTAILMGELFSSLASKQEVAKALRDAQIARIERLRSRYGKAQPYLWAAFTVTGYAPE